MNAWVKFVNKTGINVIYLSVNERFIPFPTVSRSPFVLTECGSVTVDIFDGGLKFIKSVYISIFPAKIQTVYLY